MSFLSAVPPVIAAAIAYAFLGCALTGKFNLAAVRTGYIAGGLTTGVVLGAMAVHEGTSRLVGWMIAAIVVAVLAWLAPYVISAFADREKTDQDTPQQHR